MEDRLCDLELQICAPFGIYLINILKLMMIAGAVQIKNWRPLDLDQVTDNSLVSVEDMLGDLTTVATLRIRITR